MLIVTRFLFVLQFARQRLAHIDDFNADKTSTTAAAG